jgi:hypothetical protein
VLVLSDEACIDCGSLRVLTKIESLARLEVDLRNFNSRFPAKKDNLQTSFQSLKYLTLRGELAIIIGLFDCFKSTKMHSIELSVLAPDEMRWLEESFGRDGREVFSKLHSLYEKSLRHVQVGYTHPTEVWEKHVFTGASESTPCYAMNCTNLIVEPLLASHLIEEIEFTSFPRLPLSDKDVQDILNAWPYPDSKPSRTVVVKVCLSFSEV